LDKNLCITAMNKALLDTIKKSRGFDIKIGDSIFLLVPEDDLEEYRLIYNQVLDGTSVTQEKEWSSGNFTEEFYEPIRDAENEVTGIAVFSRNISERKKIEVQLIQSLEEEKKLNEQLAWREEELTTQEEELRSSYEHLTLIHDQLLQSEKKFEAISTCTNGAIYDWDIVGDNLVWSPGFKNIFGYDAAGLPFTLKMWENALLPETKQVTLDSLAQAFESGLEIWDQEYKIMQADGQIAHLAEKGQIFRDEKGVPYRMVGGIRDVTAQKRALEELKIASHFLNCIIDNMPIGIMVIGKDGNVSKMNKSYLKGVGLSEDFVVSGHYNILNDQMFMASNSIRHLEVAQSGGIVVNEEVMVDFGSSFNTWSARNDKAWFSLTMFPIFDSGETVAVVGIMNEITANKLAQEKIEKNVLQIIETNKKMAEYRLMALRSVMNPHFLFNSLNSIQSFIATNEKKQAINYLSLFSKLIRFTLNSSLDNHNTLAEEIEILKLYINLEKLRFDNKFSESFDIDETIDLEGVEIPSLILQPFVENAILHGLYNKEGSQGKLDIQFQISEGKLLCVVEDNGIGRKAAEKIKANNKLHKSVGMMLTKERIELINQGDALSVQIIDLVDEKKQPSGTRVEVRMNIIKDNFLAND
jgi:PAS domain S-box-containing protein